MVDIDIVCDIVHGHGVSIQDGRVSIVPRQHS